MPSYSQLQIFYFTDILNENRGWEKKNFMYLDLAVNLYFNL